jgi:hypothetical protein
MFSLRSNRLALRGHFRDAQTQSNLLRAPIAVRYRS